MSPSSSLQDKFKSLGVKVGAREVEPARPRPTRFPIESVVPGRLEKNALGEVFISDQYYPAGHRHGKQSLFPGGAFHMLARWAGDEALGNMPPQVFAYLDTETSGLAGGTGTYCFMVGTARLENDVFHLAQFFMRDPGEEAALLLALENFLSPCQALVTFNGKSFDAPLLNTRFTLQGLHTPLPGMAHIDLLHLARRVYRERLANRSLGSLEAELLEVRRGAEEVPGYLIPEYYFEYLRNGDARPMANVFYHNALDVLSMAALLSHLGGLLEDPLGAENHGPLDHAALGRLFEDLADDEMAARLYRYSLENGLPDRLFWETLERLAQLHKRRAAQGVEGEQERAMALWKKAANHGLIYAHVELAKVFEHSIKDEVEALHWTEAALKIVSSPAFSSLERQEWQAALLHRQERLQRKHGPAG